MRSFKQFLKEDNTVYEAVLLISKTINTQHQIKDDKLQQLIIDKINEKLKCDSSIAVNFGAFDINIILNDELISKANYVSDVIIEILSSLNVKYEPFANKEVLNITIKNGKSLPKLHSPIEFSNVSLTFDSKISLSGIHKFISSSCDHIYLKNLSNVTDSVLGLIKIGKKPRQILLNDFGQLPKWFDIIANYINKSSDILACQEELIENGLEQYAQL